MTRTPPTSTRTRFRGERGIAVIMTALCLLPLMAFAAFGVDLASFYSRASYLQKSADAAALAGTVWMPSITKARQVACDSLLENGIDGGDCGTGPFDVTVARGSTATSLLVTVSDPSASKYFSQVLGDGSQRLTRSAEAEYNLPLPLGSPLNYFGGDATQTNNLSHTEYWDEVAWPTDYNQLVHAPVNTPCNIGTSAAQDFGRWTNATTFVANGFSGSTRCLFEVRQGAQSGTTTTAPPDYDRLTNVPTNTPCNAFASPTNGRWESATVWNAGARYSSGTGNRLCTWRNWTTSSAPSTTYRSNAANINGSVRPCNLGYQDVNGRWPASGAYATGSRFTGLHSAGNQFCQYYAEINANVAHTIADPNPIPADRSPGFWAMIYGPGQYAANGDAFSTRCTSQFNCSSVQNVHYRAVNDPNRGYWYVVQVPTGVSGSIDINVFDASYNHDAATKIMDSTEGSGTPDFETEFKVYKQTNPLDFTVRSNVFTSGSGSNNPTDGGCWWKLRKESGFFKSWSKLCTITGVQPGDTYLVNVRTNTVGAANEAGNNGYAIEAVLNGDRHASPGPSIYAYADMSIANQNVCPTGTCDGTFYLAKVGPQFAGRTLVIEMYDAGDSTGAGVSTVYPMKPSPSAAKPSVNVAAADCDFTAVPDPNDYIDTSDLRIHTGARRVAVPTAPDSADGSCGIRATVSGVRQFNGEWLRIRVEIPAGYTCNASLNNPEVESNTCWWGIRYRFNGNASDTTTWQARVEGNPVHLTA